MLQERSYGAVVFKRNRELKFLLLHYEAGHWGFVKGKIEKGETPKETVIRELEEETGLTPFQFVGNFKEETDYFYKKSNRTVYKKVGYFLVQVQSQEVTISYEHVGYAWLSYTEAQQRLTFQNAKSVLQKAYQLIQNKAIP